MKKLALLIVFVLLVVAVMGAVKFFNKFKEEDSTAWKIEVTSEYINVRIKPSSLDSKIGTIKQGEKYVVLNMYLEDDKYVWYQIKYSNYENAWIASDRNNPYVKEINNPNVDDENSYSIDYSAPVIKYYEDEYYTKDLSTITYNHLNIVHSTDCEIESQVYIEDCPDYRQYWIQYKVTTAFGKTAKKVQKIYFEDEPGKNEVPSMKEIRKSICEG